MSQKLMPNMQGGNSQIILNDVSVFSFDKLGHSILANSPKAFMWVATATFSSYLSTATTEKNNPIDLNARTNRTNNAYFQKCAVRVLANLLIRKILTENTSVSLTTGSIENNTTNCFVDETSYPYIVTNVRFPISFSHSQNKVACVIQRRGQLGIDVELNDISMKVCQRFFAKEEIEWLLSIDKPWRQSANKLLWMLKESAIKHQSQSNTTLIPSLQTSFLQPAKNLFDQYMHDISSPTVNDHIQKQSTKIYHHLDDTWQLNNKIKQTHLYLYLPEHNLLVISSTASK